MQLEIKQISKQYKDTLALNEVSLTFTPGFWGLLGANGAGKTTLQNILVGLLAQTDGEVLWDGTEIHALGAAYRAILGYMPQAPKLYPAFSAADYLRYMAALKDVFQKRSEKPKLEAKINELLELVHLQDAKKKHIGAFSGGMRQRIGIAGALLGDPKLIVLDEPTAGLDPAERISLKNIISSISLGKIVIWATHIVSDLESVADNIALIHQGKLRQCGTPDALTQSIKDKVWIVLTDPHTAEGLQSTQKVGSVFKQDGKVGLRIVSDISPHPDATPTAPNLEDVCLYHMMGGLGK